MLIAFALLTGLAVGYLVGFTVCGRQTISQLAALSLRAEQERKEARLQIANAFDQATKVMTECRLAIAESRGVLKEGIELAKAAAKTMIGPLADEELPPATSVHDADTKVVRARRQDAGAKG